MFGLTRRSFLRAAAGGAMGAALGSTDPVDAATAARPNIILCMADDQGWGDVAYNGHPLLKTPHLDEAAAAGLRFDRFYAAAPVCSPTRGSVMTGRHPNRFGCFNWGYTLRPGEVTLPQALKQAGYVTGHFGKWHLGSVEKGSPVNPGAVGFDEWFSAWNFFDIDPILSREGKAVQCTGDSSTVTVDAALEFIRKHNDGDPPFLAVVWFGSPHKPHSASDDDRAPYSGQSEAYQHLLGEITAMDRAFGKLRATLDDMGIRDDTILWYCSDNGGLPEVGSTGGRGNKAQLYEGGIRVPAFIEWPTRIQAPKTSGIPCCTSDIYPTLLDIAGVTVNDQPVLDGISLKPLFEGRTETRTSPIGFWVHPSKGRPTPSAELMTALLRAQQEGREIAHPDMLSPHNGVLDTSHPEVKYPGHAAWLAWPWKLHHVPTADPAVWQTELYDLDDDPDEQNNLAEAEPERAQRMLRELNAWQESVAGSLTGTAEHENTHRCEGA